MRDRARQLEAVGRAAGPIRNRAMLEIHKPCALVAFAGVSGTADMIEQAKHAGVMLIRVSVRLVAAA